MLAEAAPLSPGSKPLAQNAARLLTAEAVAAPQQSSRSDSRQSSLNGSGRVQQQQQPDVELSPVSSAAAPNTNTEAAAPSDQSLPSRVPLLNPIARTQNAGVDDSEAEDDAASARAAHAKSLLHPRDSDRKRLTPGTGSGEENSQSHRTAPGDGARSQHQTGHRSHAAGSSEDSSDVPQFASSSSSSTPGTPRQQQQHSRPAAAPVNETTAPQPDEAEEESRTIQSCIILYLSECVQS